MYMSSFQKGDAFQVHVLLRQLILNRLSGRAFKACFHDIFQSDSRFYFCMDLKRSQLSSFG